MTTSTNNAPACNHPLPTDPRGLSEAVCPICEGEMDSDLTDEDWATSPAELLQIANDKAIKAARQATIRRQAIRAAAARDHRFNQAVRAANARFSK